MTELETNPLPDTVSVNAGSPAVAEAGEIPLTEGIGVGTNAVKVTEPDRPPPGAGLNTVTWLVEAKEMSREEMSARSCPEVTKVVGRSLPFQRTTDPGTNPVPFTVS
jgi:hypothetical protein